jgi:hypothetical protein
MRIAESVKLLAAPFPVQDAFLSDVSENAATTDFRLENDISRMVILFLGSITVFEGNDGTECVEHWRSRTQIPSGVTLQTEWLSTALRMLIATRRPYLFTRHGLRSAPEWRLIRHLAGQMCDAMAWPRTVCYPHFEALWKDLSDGVLEEVGIEDNI